MGTRCADHVTPLYPQKLALTSPTGGGIVCSRTKATEFSFSLVLCLLIVPSIICLFITGFVISLYSLEMFFYEVIKWCQQHGHVPASCSQFPALRMTYSKTNFMSQAGQFPPHFIMYSNTKFISHSSQFPTLLMSFWYKIRVKRMIIYVLDCNEP